MECKYGFVNRFWLKPMECCIMIKRAKARSYWCFKSWNKSKKNRWNIKFNRNGL